jgi:hypothetical protein
MSSSIRERILRGCYAFLVPVARFLIRSGISYREFHDVAQSAFVHVASVDYGVRGRKTNASRVAAMTGIGRRTVRAIQESIRDYDQNPRVGLSPLGDLLHRWYTDPNFKSECGSPAPLPFSGAEKSFERLVKLVAGDLPPNAVRVELLRCGALVHSSDGSLCPTRREVIPDRIDERLISSISFNLYGLASTIAYNSNPTKVGPGRIERFVQSNAISDALRDTLRKRVRTEISRFTEEIDDLFATEESSGVGPAPSRIGVGVYYHEDSDE